MDNGFDSSKAKKTELWPIMELDFGEIIEMGYDPSEHPPLDDFPALRNLPKVSAFPVFLTYRDPRLPPKSGEQKLNLLLATDRLSALRDRISDLLDGHKPDQSEENPD